MPEFSLPKGSVVSKEGKVYGAASGPNHKKFVLYRYSPEDGENPSLDVYYVDTSNCGPMILDVLLKIKNELDPTLSFRRSCREGVCGSCAVNVDGKNVLACTKSVNSIKKNEIAVYPLPHMQVVKDLVVKLDHFFEQYKKVRPWLIPDPADQPSKERFQTQEQVDVFKKLTDCVLCACCSTSCPNYWWNSDKYLGPAALLNLCRFVLDSRDGATKERLSMLSEDEFSLFGCRTILNCSFSCPKELNPGEAIAQLKRLAIDN